MSGLLNVQFGTCCLKKGRGTLPSTWNLHFGKKAPSTPPPPPKKKKQKKTKTKVQLVIRLQRGHLRLHRRLDVARLWTDESCPCQKLSARLFFLARASPCRFCVQTEARQVHRGVTCDLNTRQLEVTIDVPCTALSSHRWSEYRFM